MAALLATTKFLATLSKRSQKFRRAVASKGSAFTIQTSQDNQVTIVILAFKGHVPGQVMRYLLRTRRYKITDDRIQLSTQEVTTFDTVVSMKILGKGSQFPHP